MADGQPKRVLEGALVPTLLTGVAQTVHTLDATPAGSGGPYVSQVTLVFGNIDTAAGHTVTVQFGSDTAQTYTVPQGSTLKLYDDTPFQGSGVAIKCSDAGQTGKLFVWGSFTRR